MNSAETDLELIRRVKSGEHTAYDELMRRYNRRIYQVLYSMTRSNADTEDLVQEAFIRAYDNIRRFDERYRFYTWLYRIAVNLCFTFLKRRGSAPVSLDASFRDDDPQPEPADEKGPGLAAQSDQRRNIERALALLPAEQRMALVLRTYDGMSYEQIAEAMHTSIGTVMSRLSRARDKMRELLRGYLTGT